MVVLDASARMNRNYTGPSMLSFLVSVGWWVEGGFAPVQNAVVDGVESGAETFKEHLLTQLDTEHLLTQLDTEHLLTQLDTEFNQPIDPFATTLSGFYFFFDYMGDFYTKM